MRSPLYILVNGEPVSAPDAVAWGTWFTSSHAERVVATTELVNARVSTVFLAIDADVAALPVLWETCVFSAHGPSVKRKYTSRADALAGHAAVVADLEKRESLDWKMIHRDTCTDDACAGCKKCERCGTAVRAYGFEDHLCFNCRHPPSD